MEKQKIKLIERTKRSRDRSTEVWEGVVVVEKVERGWKWESSRLKSLSIPR